MLLNSTDFFDYIKIFIFTDIHYRILISGVTATVTGVVVVAAIITISKKKYFCNILQCSAGDKMKLYI